MKAISKKELILDAMQDLMSKSQNQSISVSDIAKKAGIGKGSIYYYFKSKNDILEAVMERSYSNAITKGKQLVQSKGIDAFTKMKIIFNTCRESSTELNKQEHNSYFEIQQGAFLHQKYLNVMVKSLKPILTDIIKQGILEGTICCINPEEIAEIVLIVLTVKLDNYTFPSTPKEIQNSLDTFSKLLESGMKITHGNLDFLKY